VFTWKTDEWGRVVRVKVVWWRGVSVSAKVVLKQNEGLVFETEHGSPIFKGITR